MSDEFARFPIMLSDVAVRHVQIVPSDTANLAVRPRAIYCATDGTIMIRDELGVDLSYTVTAGQILPFRGVRILATGTSGTFYGWT